MGGRDCYNTFSGLYSSSSKCTSSCIINKWLQLLKFCGSNYLIKHKKHRHRLSINQVSIYVSSLNCKMVLQVILYSTSNTTCTVSLTCP